MSEDAFEARYSKLRVLLLMVGAAGFVILGAWVAGLIGETPRPDRAWLGWIAIIFFGFCLIAIGRRLFDDDVQLRVDRHGLMSKPWSDATIPWHEIVAVGVWEHRRQNVIVLKLADPDRFPSSTMMGKLAGTNRMLTGGDVSISMTGTDRGFDEAMQAIGRYLPQ